MSLRALPLLASLVLATVATATSPAAPLPLPTRLHDAVNLAEPGSVKLGGWLGQRVDRNVSARLAAIDTEPLLAGYRHRPGEHPWIGEHVGKWLHAATLAWAYTGDAALRQKLDAVVTQLIATQEADGYLGTYTRDKRFGLYEGADWDVWSHKYNLIGLLTYVRYTGNPAALNACKRMADLLIATFPQQKSILAAGTHMGMAATSVLEPIVQLYEQTGDMRYLEFAQYILKSYDEPNGPRIVDDLLAGKGVNQIANGKAYEMLSNLVGLCEYARATGDTRVLQAVEHAWSDITSNRRYASGTASSFELFGADHELPNGEEAHIGETCVTTTWIQLNLQLLRLTGDAKFADEIERAAYNHLAAAQNPRGDDWCYYTPLEGVKHYDKGITCCHSSGPRGFALLPTAAYLHSDDTIFVDTFETSSATVTVGGTNVRLEQQSEFPRTGRSVVTLRMNAPAGFRMLVRVPEWALPMKVGAIDATKTGWAEVPARTWHDGDKIELQFSLKTRERDGAYTNFARTAFTWGPFLLALDSADNPKLETLADARPLHAHAPALVRNSNRLEFDGALRGTWDLAPRPATFVTFADAGASGTPFRVWLRAAQ